MKVFGMQIIEAMSCKTLVLASDIPVFEEKLPRRLLFKLNVIDIIKKLTAFLDKKMIRKYSTLLYKKCKKYRWDIVTEKLL